MALLSVDTISKSYERVQAVKNLSFQLEAGEILGIVGKSGSGKTTLIKMVAGFIQPDQGNILFHGKHLEGPEEKLVPGHEEIRLVHQDFKLHHRMTVEENLHNALIDYVNDYRKERTDELLELCNISDIRRHYVHEISGGEKQRVAISMAMATDPEILLFDEPFSNLDLNTKSILLQEIKDLAKVQNTAIVMITHDSRDVMEIADNLIVVADGEMMRQGTPREIYQSPKYIEVAQLMGKFNLIDNQDFIRKEINSSNGKYGLWPEDIQVNKGPLKGTVKQVVFAGSHHRVHLITASGQGLWIRDFDKQLKPNEEVSLNINSDKLFTLKDKQ